MELLQGDQNVWIKLDPRTKLLVLLCINLVCMVGINVSYMIPARLTLGLLPAALLLLAKRHNNGLTCGLLFLAGFVAEVFVVFSFTGVVNFILVMTAGVFTRLGPVMMMGYYLIKTTTVSEFVAAMERLHLPRQIIIPLSVMFRFLPTVAEEAAAIGDAMRMRGVSFSGGNPLGMLEYRLVPLMMSTVKIGEELSAASLTRGLGNPGRRTNICRLKFNWLDAVCALLALGALAVYLFL